MKGCRFILTLGLTALFALPLGLRAEELSAFEFFDILTASSPQDSRSKEWKPGDGITLEVGGLAWIGPERLAVATRKGEVWLLDGVLSDDRDAIRYQLFASGLHEPLGLLREGEDLLVIQRSEVTRLRDTDGDGIADEYLTAGDGWGVSGNYHEYAYGPARDGRGNLWVTLNLGIGEHSNNSKGWRGWGGTINAEGRFVPQSLGMRSPAGLGANLEGEMFYTDQQGNWVPATPIYRLRPGVFYGNQQSLDSLKSPQAPFQLSVRPRPDQNYPAALAECPEFVPPAVWLPYHKMGRSGTDLQVIEQQEGGFAAFRGQFLVGEFTNSAVNRVFLEKVGGEYQGACFPFLEGFPSAVVRLAFAPDGSLFVGMTNRGWSSLGNRAYGLTRVRLREQPPFAIREMRVKPDGFELEFTEPIDTEGSNRSFSMSSFTYYYSSAYGSDEIDGQEHEISAVEVAPDARTVRLRVSGLRPLYVHELRTTGLKSVSGRKLDYPNAWYTLNQLPD